VRSGPALAFYPGASFQFSTTAANSRGGSDGMPDPDDPEKDDLVQNLLFSFPMVAQLEDWNGWFSVNILYTRSLTEATNFLFVQTDIGKMIGPNSAASLHITKFVAGQPRLNVMVQAQVFIFMR
jgi:hypothetical protein